MEQYIFSTCPMRFARVFVLLLLFLTAWPRCVALNPLLHELWNQWKITKLTIRYSWLGLINIILGSFYSPEPISWVLGMLPWGNTMHTESIFVKNAKLSSVITSDVPMKNIHNLFSYLVRTICIKSPKMANLHWVNKILLGFVASRQHYAVEDGVTFILFMPLTTP